MSFLSMGGQSPVLVFISYARRDATKLARDLKQDLEARDFEVWLDTNQISGGATWTTEIEKAIDSAQVVLAILTRGSYSSEICRAEQLRSLRNGKFVIPLLGEHGSDIPLHLEPKNYRDFSNPQSYSAQLEMLVDDIRQRRNDAQLKEQYRTTYVTAPPLPRNYVQRGDALAKLRALVITERHDSTLAIAALRGMGGIGKTVLAQALCLDEVVQEAFPDGIAWITLGKDSGHSLQNSLREIGKVFSRDLSGYDSEEASINAYRTALREKAALIVVDDVWSVRQLEPFLGESHRSRVLFTTRLDSVAAAVGADVREAELPSEQESWHILAQWAGWKQDYRPQDAAALIAECGRLPLALAMIGASLRNKPPAYWKNVLDLLRAADLGKIKQEIQNYPYNLLRAMQVSVDMLDQRERDRYLALAVTPEDMSIPSAVQQALWDADAGDALYTAEQFLSASLAQRDAEHEAIRLHDIQLAYLRAVYPNTDDLKFISDAFRLSAHVLNSDPRQFVPQMLGRLLYPEFGSSIHEFALSLARAVRYTWLRPIRPALHPPGTPLMRTLTGHNSQVPRVVITSDGKFIVSASHDQTLKIWDMETGDEIRTLRGHSSGLTGVAATPDSRTLISASTDKTLKLWDLETGRELRTLQGHTGPVHAVAVSSDGRMAASGSADKTLRIWDLVTGQQRFALEGHSDTINGVAFTPDGRRGVSVSNDKTLKVWDVQTATEVFTLSGHQDSVQDVAITPDGKYALSSSWDCQIGVWDLDEGTNIGALPGHEGYGDGIAISSDGRWVASASWDKTVRIWDLQNSAGHRKLEGHSFFVRGVAISPDARQAVSSSWDGEIKVWDLESKHDVQPFRAHNDSISGIAVDRSGRRAISASWDKTLKLWDVETGLEIRTIETNVRIEAVAMDATGRLVLSGSDQLVLSGSDRGALELWDTVTGERIRVLSDGNESHGTSAIAFTHDGARALVASRYDGLKFWDVVHAREICTLHGDSRNINAIALAPDSAWAVTAHDNNAVRLWDLNAGKELRVLGHHNSQVLSVAVTPDGSRVISTSFDRRLKIWDVKTASEVGALDLGRPVRTNDVAISPDGRLAVSASGDGVRAWELETGKLLATFSGDAGQGCCAFATDRIVIAGDGVGRLQFLFLEPGKSNC